MAKRPPKKESFSIEWNFPSFKSARTEKDGIAVYVLTHKPFVRLIWNTTQCTIILFGRTINLK